jgi:hypothetical protein
MATPIEPTISLMFMFMCTFRFAYTKREYRLPLL